MTIIKGSFMMCSLDFSFKFDLQYLLPVPLPYCPGCSIYLPLPPNLSWYLSSLDLFNHSILYRTTFCIVIDHHQQLFIIRYVIIIYLPFYWFLIDLFIYLVYYHQGSFFISCWVYLPNLSGILHFLHLFQCLQIINC